MNVKDKKPVSKSKLLTLIKDLDWRSVKAALEQNPDLLKHRGDKGANLLHLCCGIDIEKRGLSAADSIKTAGVLLDATLDINREAFTEGEWKATLLWYAVGRGKNLELAKYLLKRGADLTIVLLDNLRRGTRFDTVHPPPPAARGVKRVLQLRSGFERPSPQRGSSGLPRPRAR